MVKFTRRQLLISGGATAAVAAGGVAYVASGDVVEFVAAFVRQALHTENIAPGATEEFAAAYLLDGQHEDLGQVRQLMWLHRSLGYAGMELMVGGFAPYANFKRRVATAFMLGSNFFYRQDANEPVEFVAVASACSNPFARFT